MQQTETPVRAFAFCRTPVCPGYKQVEVDALAVESAFMFTDNGGDIPGVERSTIEHRFTRDEDRDCPSCGCARELSSQERPSYDPLSGFDPMGLVQATPFDPAVRTTEQDAKIAELEAKLNRLVEAAEQS